MNNNDIVQKLWNLCDVLRDDGINYSDYVTELVLLLFIKMVHENTEAGTLKKHPLPEGCRWTDINGKSGINLLNDYKRILLSLSTGKDGDGTGGRIDQLGSFLLCTVGARHGRVVDDDGLGDVAVEVRDLHVEDAFSVDVKALIEFDFPLRGLS